MKEEILLRNNEDLEHLIDSLRFWLNNNLSDYKVLPKNLLQNRKFFNLMVERFGDDYGQFSPNLSFLVAFPEEFMTREAIVNFIIHCHLNKDDNLDILWDKVNPFLDDFYVIYLIVWKFGNKDNNYKLDLVPYSVRHNKENLLELFEVLEDEEQGPQNLLPLIPKEFFDDSDFSSTIFFGSLLELSFNNDTESLVMPLDFYNENIVRAIMENRANVSGFYESLPLEIIFSPEVQNKYSDIIQEYVQPKEVLEENKRKEIMDIVNKMPLEKLEELLREL